MIIATIIIRSLVSPMFSTICDRSPHYCL